MTDRRIPDTVTQWQSLPEFAGQIDAADQVLFVATTGGAKSTLAATLSLDIPSLIAIDDKGSLTLPNAHIFDLPAYNPKQPKAYDEAIASAIRWRGNDLTALDRFFGNKSRATNRVILRVDAADVDDPAPHNAIFRVIYRDRPDTIVWIDEISATGATPQTVPIYLRAISARGRTRGIGLWTLTQAPYGMMPRILRRNAQYQIIGPIMDDDAHEMKFDGADIAAGLPTKQGYFIVRKQGDRTTYRLRVPIPARLKGWKAP